MRVRLRQRKLRRASVGRPGQPLRYPRTNILLFQYLVIVTSVFGHSDGGRGGMNVVEKVFYFQNIVIVKDIF